MGLEVKDNGRGFNPIAAPGQSEGHFGLQGMHERVKRLGGELDVRSIPGDGTSIHVWVPVPTESPKTDA